MQANKLAELIAQKEDLERKITAARMQLIKELLVETRKKEAAGKLSTSQQKLLKRVNTTISVALHDVEFLLDTLEDISSGE